MIAAYVNSLAEAVNRRMGLVMLGLSAVVAIVFNWIVRFAPLPGGRTMILFGNRILGPDTVAAPSLFKTEVQFTGGLWLLLGIFAAAPLLSSTLDRGWTELTLSKGTARWRILIGRYFGGITLYFLALMVTTMPLGIRIWLKTGVQPGALVMAAVIQCLAFGALMAVAALAILPQTGIAVPIMVAVLTQIASPFLAQRQQTFYQIFSSHAVRGIFDWMYWILPKCYELNDLSTAYIESGHIANWWPVWSTAAFLVAVLALTMWLLHRKSF